MDFRSASSVQFLLKKSRHFQTLSNTGFLYVLSLGDYLSGSTNGFGGFKRL
jgi:hypothetical protein